MTIYMTVERHPLELVDGDSLPFTLKSVAVGFKNGIEFQISDGIVDPKAECWFAITVVYPWQRKDRTLDNDVFITDGDQFFLCRRSLGKSQLPFTKTTRNKLLRCVRGFVKTL